MQSALPNPIFHGVFLRKRRRTVRESFYFCVKLTQYTLGNATSYLAWLSFIIISNR
jgi:hypothetical protein